MTVAGRFEPTQNMRGGTVTTGPAFSRLFCGHVKDIGPVAASASVTASIAGGIFFCKLQVDAEPGGWRMGGIGNTGVFLKWWQDPELNRGHKDFQSSALPTELSCLPTFSNLRIYKIAGKGDVRQGLKNVRARCGASAADPSCGAADPGAGSRSVSLRGSTHVGGFTRRDATP